MKAILFDFGGTLDADGRTWVDRFYDVYRQEGLMFPRSEFDRAFYCSDDTLAEKHPLAGLPLEETLRLQVDSVLSILAPDRLNRRDGIVNRFLEDSRSHFRRNRPLLERLARRYRLGIVSNFYGNLDSVLSSEGLRSLFAVIADSAVVGAVKPAPSIFLSALSVLDCRPEDSLMVGDSLERDMRGAEKLGMKHALLSANGGVSCCSSVWRLKNLPELESFLSA